MKRQAYLDFIKKHEEELSNFPIAYAYNEEQLKEALKKLGVESAQECVSVMGHGDIVKIEDAPKLIAMFKRHTKELHEALEADKELAEEAFLYEMDNHEYAINWSGDVDVLNAFALTRNDLLEKDLKTAYLNARRRHFKHAKEWGII